MVPSVSTMGIGAVLLAAALVALLRARANERTVTTAMRVTTMTTTSLAFRASTSQMMMRKRRSRCHR